MTSSRTRTQQYGTGTLRSIGPRRWRLRVFAGRGSNGAVRHINRTFTGTETQARRELARVSAEVQRGQLSITGREPFGELLDRWLAQIEPTRRPKTIAEYRAKIEHRIRPALGSTRIDRIRPAQLDALYRQWLDEGLSPTTVHHHHAIISTALRQAERWRLDLVQPRPASVPAADASGGAHHPRPVTAPRSDRWRRAVRGPHARYRNRPGDWLTGARRGELCALRWSDLDLAAGTVRIARSLTVVGAVVHVGPTKTHAERKMALGEVGVDTLLRRRLRMEEFAAQVGVPLDPDPFVLSASDAPRADRNLMPDRLSQRFTKLCRTLGISFRFHDLRHFAATQLIAGLRGGASPARLLEASRSAGRPEHTTLRIYSHAITDRDEHAADVLGALLPPAPAPSGNRDLVTVLY